LATRTQAHIIATNDAALTVSLDNASEFTGKIDPMDLSVKNNLTWNMTADFQDSTSAPAWCNATRISSVAGLFTTRKILRGH
jgi:hypothetical protein